MFADLSLSAAVMAGPGFSPNSQHLGDLDGSIAPAELPRQSRPARAHANSVERSDNRMNRVADELFGHENLEASSLLSRDEPDSQLSS